MELLVVAAVLVLGLRPLVSWVSRRRSRGAAIATGVAAVVGAVLAAGVFHPRAVSESRVTDRPIQVPEPGDTSSTACRACHPDQYASWHASYHRTMTQVPSPDSVRAPWNLELHGEWYGASGPAKQRTYTLLRRGDEYWVRSDDPDFSKGSLPPGLRKVVLITGSHHQQFFWYATGSDRRIAQLPIAYSIRQGRWVPLRALLLGPATFSDDYLGGWNLVCVRCHSTHGKPGMVADEVDLGGVSVGRFAHVDTRATEFGIACEACHGGAAAHVAANHDPVRRYLEHFEGEHDDTIVNPARLSGRRATDVCGSCHSIHQFGHGSEADLKDFLAHGFRFRPGDDLSKTRFVARYSDRDDPAFADIRKLEPLFFDTRFWPDGMPSVNGREMNGLLESKCFQRSKDFSCLSCHRLHYAEDDPRPVREWADDQLDHRKLGNEACLGCHEQYRGAVTEHTHHAADSSGSLCYNCHMPNTTYGLLKQTRSHLIDSPTVSSTLETGRPNACNLCHLDQTLDWTARTLEKWYGTPRPRLSDPDDYFVAYGAEQALRGDAGVRAMLAWHMGWRPAIEASGDGWMVPVLASLLEDPYLAVRYIAGHSLQAHAGFEDFPFEYLATPADLAASHEAALQRWAKVDPPASRRRGEAILIGSDGRSKRDRIEQYRAQRDDRVVYRME